MSPPNTSVPFDWKGFWDMAAHVGQLIALGVAGIWAYFNFIEGRTYYPRMELICSGSVIAVGDKRKLFLPRLTLKHIGKSKILLRSAGSGYKLLFSDGVGNTADQIDWETDGNWYGVFGKHKWIEPDEVIFHEAEAFVIPPWAVTVKLQGRIVGEVRPAFRAKSIEWNNSVIIACGNFNGAGVTKQPKQKEGDLW